MSAHEHPPKIDAAFDALNTLLDNTGALDEDRVKLAAYALRLAIVRGLGDEDRISAAQASFDELSEDVIRCVVDDVLQRRREFGFRQDADGVRDAVEESSGLLNIALSEDQAVRACELVIEEQDAAPGPRM